MPVQPKMAARASPDYHRSHPYLTKSSPYVPTPHYNDRGQFEKAIEEYRKAIREVKDKALEAQLLVDRSLAYAA